MSVSAMLQTVSQGVAVPTAIFVAWHGTRVLSEVGLLVYMLISMLGMMISGWMLYRIHLLRSKAHSYGEMVRQLYGISDGTELVVSKSLMIVLPLIQWIIHLALNQVQLDSVFAMVGVRGALSLVLIGITAVPYGLKLVPWLSMIGWICLGVAGAFSWTSNQIFILPSHFSAAIASSLIIQLVAISMMGSFLTVAEYLSPTAQPLIGNGVIQMLSISYPFLFGSAEFKPVAYYLCIPISLASLLLFSHYMYQRVATGEEGEAPPTPLLRYVVPLTLLLVTNAIALIPKVYTPFRTTMNMMLFNLISIDLFMSVGTLVILLRQSGEDVKAITIIIISASLFLTRFILTFFISK